MNPEFAYFLKVNTAFVLFYAFYRLFFYKDTFFKLRRFILLSFFVIAFLYPLLNIQEWVSEQEPIAEAIQLYTMMLPEVDVRAEGMVGISWFSVFRILSVSLFFIVVIILLVRFFFQLSCIIRLAYKSQQGYIQQIPIRLLPKPAGPFSFFRLIFIHPQSHSEKETEEILIHEYTHVSQWHSVDVVLCELVSIFCWYNPFVWLLKREVRHNLEYLADNKVLESGYDSKSYQYHLLGLAHQPQSGGLYNRFNMLHLKNRILMMNKKRTHGLSRTKYLVFIPLAGMLMLLSNMEAVARITKNLSRNVTAITDDPAVSDISQSGVDDNNTISMEYFTVVDQMPRFPGGDQKLLDYISQHIRYPEEAIRERISGIAVCSFIVAKDGTIHNTEIVRSVSPTLDAEALRVVQSMPVWEPGVHKGEAVAVKYTVPINFRLPEKKETEADTDQVFTVVESMPQFPGGDQELLRFISRSIKYPRFAQEHGIQGRVVCSFIVHKSGKIKDFEIVRSVDAELDQEALRVLSLMPEWEPGRQRGKAVSVKYTVPIMFRLQ
ncbi:M56 family metallopeptidase [Parabacteroides sp. PF5-9]|uniref:M56 family metallopeptidase n=1 Tax=Parabacteroides sp. PF5-9 TaxID=1742404 RepID=UPI00247454B7|nr:M56 family metallopeptidase [Parabacteroides sp. PF5-9]MDH6356853.1 TonB family protein [Parabacteroides sp. PF5-9]